MGLMGWVATVGAVLLVAGCGVFERPEPGRDCPQTSVIAAANRAVKFSGPGRDLTDILVEAEILSAVGKCSYRRDQVVGDTLVRFIAAAGPALRNNQGAVDYFVAITDGAGNVVAKQEFQLAIRFEGNVSTVELSEELRQTIPLAKGANAGSYQILVGFQLTREELAYNRRLIGR
jgi:hypothetical protein